MCVSAIQVCHIVGVLHSHMSILMMTVCHTGMSHWWTLCVMAICLYWWSCLSCRYVTLVDPMCHHGHVCLYWWYMSVIQVRHVDGILCHDHVSVLMMMCVSYRCAMLMESCVIMTVCLYWWWWHVCHTGTPLVDPYVSSWSCVCIDDDMYLIQVCHIGGPLCVIMAMCLYWWWCVCHTGAPC